MKIEWTDPRNLIIAAGGIIGLLMLAPKLGDGWDFIVKVGSTTKVAYAADAKSDAIRSDFDRYLAETKVAQEKALIKQQSYIEAQQVFNKRLLAIQQQQVVQPSFKEYDAQGIAWCCDESSIEDCWKSQGEYANRWWRCIP